MSSTTTADGASASSRPATQPSPSSPSPKGLFDKSPTGSGHGARPHRCCCDGQVCLDIARVTCFGTFYCGTAMRDYFDSR